MALRVLLADESPTIKKVFQLALQDFAVDVASVGMGPDVLQVARQFKPDIVFCDILLQKRNGYDVCADFKNDAQLRTLPVILMWSAFMELDEDKLQAARADGNLQKPFEVQDLRSMVNQFVGKTRSQKLGQFLNFPKMPDMLDNPPPPGLVNSDGTPDASTGSSWNMESFDPLPPPESLIESAEDFQEVPLPPPPKAEVDALGEEPDNMEWSTKSLSRFQVTNEETVHDDMVVRLPEDGTNSEEDVVLDLEVEDETLSPKNPIQATTGTNPLTQMAKPKPSAATQPPQLSDAQIEKIVREQAKSVIEAMAWKVVPDLAAQIIERELQRLLADKSP